MTKLTYKDAKNKKRVREFLLSKFDFNTINKVIGLPGPDIEDYVNIFRNKYNIINFELYENNEEIYKMQKDYDVIFGEILNSNPFYKTALYDLDFCASTLYLEKEIQRFKSNFIMTFSTRLGILKTINKFFDYREEEIKKIVKVFEKNIRYDKIFTNKTENPYYFIRYYDTSPMCCISHIM